MRTKALGLVELAIATVVAACLSSSACLGDRYTAAEREVVTLQERHKSDWERGDIDAWAAMFTEDGQMAFVTGVIKGREAIRTVFATLTPSQSKRHVLITDRSVRVYNDGPTATAIVNFDSIVSWVDSSGKTSAPHLHDTIVFVKVNGRWAITEQDELLREG